MLINHMIIFWKMESFLYVTFCKITRIKHCWIHWFSAENFYGYVCGSGDETEGLCTVLCLSLLPLFLFLFRVSLSFSGWVWTSVLLPQTHRVLELQVCTKAPGFLNVLEVIVYWAGVCSVGCIWCLNSFRPWTGSSTLQGFKGHFTHCSTWPVIIQTDSSSLIRQLKCLPLTDDVFVFEQQKTRTVGLIKR